MERPVLTAREAAGELEALGHDVVTDAAVPPTCVSDGLTEGSHCARCGKCEGVCPQKLPIRASLAQLQQELDAL